MVGNTPKSSGGFLVGQSASDLVGFYGTTPVVQPSGSAQAAAGTTASTSSSPFGFATSTQADALINLVNAMRSALVSVGIMKGSS